MSSGFASKKKQVSFAELVALAPTAHRWDWAAAFCIADSSRSCVR